MKIIDVVTKRGDTLCGCWYGENFRNTIVIITNGTGGNIFENKFLQVVGEQLELNGISFVYAHNSGAFQIIDLPSKSKNFSGLTFEMFDNCVEDLQAYVDFAKEQGYKKIILGGHSYGCNKVVYYLYKTKCKDVDKYILLSPTDTEYHIEGEEKSIAQFNDYIAQNNPKQDDIIPFLFDKYNFFTTRTYLDFLNNSHHKNLPVYSNKKHFNQLKSINIDGLFVMGQNDVFAKRNGRNHLQIILENSNKEANNEVEVIENAGHVYRQHEQDLAKAIIDFDKNTNCN